MAKIRETAMIAAPPKRDTDHSPKKVIMAGTAILAVFFGAIALWGWFAPLHSAVHAQGELVFQNKRQSVQHQEGGIVKQILVKDGDTVIAGQPLILLEDELVKPIVDMYEGQATAESATIHRLEAEKNDLATVNFPKEIPVDVARAEMKVFTAKRDAYLKQIEMVKSQIQQTRESIKGGEEQRASKNREIASLKEQLDANKSLLKDGYVTKTIVLDLERMLAQKHGEQEQISAFISSNKEKLAELEQKILVIKAERVQQAANEIKQSSMKRLELEERVRPTRSLLSHQIIRAPIAGKVVGLRVSTVGGVVIPREPLMEIASQNDHLIVEGKIGMNDISDVKIGQEAEVTLTAFKSTKVPPVKAVVTYISADRLTTRTDKGDMPYYAVYLELDKASIDKLGGLQLLPGMQAQAAVTTMPRTAFDYLFAPFRDRVKRAFNAK